MLPSRTASIAARHLHRSPPGFLGVREGVSEVPRRRPARERRRLDRVPPAGRVGAPPRSPPGRPPSLPRAPLPPFGDYPHLVGAEVLHALAIPLEPALE